MSIYDEVRAERERAHAKHGKQSMETQPVDGPIRMTILMEEVGEVAREFNEAQGGSLDRSALRAELLQVAAMATAWADAIDPGVTFRFVEVQAPDPTQMPGTCMCGHPREEHILDVALKPWCLISGCSCGGWSPGADR